MSPKPGARGDISDRELIATGSYYLKKILFQLFNMSFCVTAMPSDTPSTRNDNLYISRCAVFFRVAALKRAVQISGCFLQKST